MIKKGVPKTTFSFTIRVVSSLTMPKVMCLIVSDYLVSVFRFGPSESNESE